jgi:hypothetical protein
MEGIKISFFGPYGVLTALLFTSALIFKYSSRAGGIALAFGIALAIIQIISDANARHREITYKNKSGYWDR